MITLDELPVPVRDFLSDELFRRFPSDGQNNTIERGGGVTYTYSIRRRYPGRLFGFLGARSQYGPLLLMLCASTLSPSASLYQLAGQRRTLQREALDW